MIQNSDWEYFVIKHPLYNNIIPGHSSSIKILNNKRESLIRTQTLDEKQQTSCFDNSNDDIYVLEKQCFTQFPI